MMNRMRHASAKRASSEGELPNVEQYRRQVETLKLFLSKHAVTQAQFDKSYRDLREKMHVRKTVVD